jgi:protocatechuate 3,4-dioxygenase beta subunit
LTLAGVLAGAVVAAWLSLGSPDPPPTTSHERAETEGRAEPLGLAPRAMAPEEAPVAVHRPPSGFDPRPLQSRIEGTVTRDGQPTPARVELRRSDGAEERVGFGLEQPGRAVSTERAPPVATTRTGEDGRFVFDDVSIGDYLLRAFAPDGHAATRQTWIRAEGERGVVDLRLVPARETLHGGVVREDGGPWRGDVLVLARQGRRWIALGSAATDDAGRFSVEGLPARRVIGFAVASNGSSVAGPTVDPSVGGEYTILWDGGRVLIEGRVVSAVDRTPISGADIEGRSTAGFPPWSCDLAKSGEDGRFRVMVPAEGGAITASAAGFVATTIEVKSGAGDVEVLLTRGARVDGLVRRRDDGRPVAGAEVRIVPQGKPRSSGLDETIEATAGEDGRFVLEGLRAGSYLLTASAAGQVSAAFLEAESSARVAAWVELRAGEDASVVVETIAAGRVWGTVADADGSPVEGARVFASRRIGGSRSNDGLPWEAYGSALAHTGRAGAYEIASLVPGVEYEIRASAPQKPSSPMARVTVGLDAAARADLVLLPARWIEVTVLEEGADAPIADAALVGSTFAETEDDDLGFHASQSQAEGRTDASGRVRLGPLGPGDVWISVSASGFSNPHTANRLEVVEGPNGPSATVRLRRGRRIAGRVLGLDGAPAASATVWLTTATGGGSSRSVATRADEGGAFAFDDVGDGDHTVRAQGPDGLASEPLPAPPGATDFTLRLARRGVLVRVVDWRGNPVPRAEAKYATNSAGIRSGQVTDGQLTFDLHDEDIAAITGTLTIGQATDRDGRPLPLGEARVEGVRPGQDVVVRMPAELTIEGRVLGPDGKGVAGARIRAESVNAEWDGQRESMEAPWTWNVSEFVRSDASGFFRIGGLGAGPHWLAVLPPVGFVPPPTRKVEAGTANVEFRVSPATSVTVMVLAPDGKPVANALVVAVRKAGQRFLMLEVFSEYRRGWSMEARTGLDGTARLLGLNPADSYVLGARGPESARLADAVTPTWKPVDATLRLSPGFSLSGTVRDAAGKAVPRAFVECTEANGVSRQTRTRADGTFSFAGLASGTVWLRASSDALLARASVETGADDVVLTLRPRLWGR